MPGQVRWNGSLTVNILTLSRQLYNMQNDLHITDKQYLIALTVFFFPYALFEVSKV